MEKGGPGASAAGAVPGSGGAGGGTGAGAHVMSEEVMNRRHRQRLSIMQTQAIVTRNPALQNIFRRKSVQLDVSDDEDNAETIVYKSRHAAAHVEEAVAPVKIREKRRSGSWVGSTVGDDTVEDDATETAQKQSNVFSNSSYSTKKEKRRLAHSLASLAAKPEARVGLVKKGAIGVLIGMSTLSDRSVQRSCVLAFSALSKEASIRAQMIEDGSMSAVVGLSSLINNVIAFEACRALCNLCIEPFAEIRAIKDGVPFALMHALSTFPNCIDVCLRAFLNLSCVAEKYPRIEEVSDALMHFNNFALTVENEILIASALCNLSAVKSFQLRLVEDGCLRFVERVIKSPQTEIRVLAGRIIDNLTTDSRTRSKMVDNGIINILLSTSKDHSEDVQTSSVRAFYNLALSDTCRVRIVNANAVKVIVQICSDQIKNVGLGRTAARILQLLCSDSRIVSKLVKDGIIKALMNLLLSDDDVIGQKCAESICSLFQTEDVKSRLIEQGAVSILVKLSESTTMAVTSEWCSFALYHLAVSSQCPLNVLEAAILPCVIKLCDERTSSNAKYFCSATLSHLSSLHQVDCSAAIPMLVFMLRGDAEKANMKALCASALYNLTNDDGNCHIMLEHGALLPVVRLTAAGDTGTKMKCAAILSRLSLQTDFHPHFATGDVLKVLLELSNIDDIYTQRKVIIAISNLCQSEMLRNQLLTLNPIQYLMSLSSKCDEHVRRGCASIVCNLAMAPGTEKAIADTGIVETLLIIAMITSDQLVTKTVCVKALVNLMADPSLYAKMVEKGLIWGLSSLANLDSPEIRLLCLKALTTLSKNFSHDMLSSTPCIRTVARAVDQSHDLELTRYGVRTLFNLLIKSSEKDLDFRKLAVMSMRHLIECDDVEISEICVMCLCLASQSESCRDDIVRAGLLKNIRANSIFTNHRICSAYLTMFENIALNPHSRDESVDENCVSRFMQICSLNNRDLHNATGRALYCISCHEQNIPILINQEVLALVDMMMVEIDYEGPDEELSKLLVATLYNLSTVESVQAQLVKQHVITLLLKLWEYAADDFSSCSLIISTVAHLACGVVNTSMLLRDGAAKFLCFIGQAAYSCYPASEFEFDLQLIERVSVSFRNLLSVVSNQQHLVASGCVPVIVEMASNAKKLISLTGMESPVLPRLSTMRPGSSKLPSIGETRRQSTANLLGLASSAGLSAKPQGHTPYTLTHAYNRAQPEHTLILNNCVSALRSLTYNPDFRGLLVDCGAMSIILEDDGDGIPMALLIDLEKESWQNGSRGPQKEARILNKKPGPLHLAILGGTKVLDVNDVVVITPTLEKYYVSVDIEELQRASSPQIAGTATASLMGSPMNSARSMLSSGAANLLSPISPRVARTANGEAAHTQLTLGIDDLDKYEDADEYDNNLMFCPKQDANDCELKLGETEGQDDANSPLSPVSPNPNALNPQSPAAAAHTRAASTERAQNSNSQSDEDDSDDDEHRVHTPHRTNSIHDTGNHTGNSNNVQLQSFASSNNINPHAAGSALSVPKRRSSSASSGRRNSATQSEAERRKSRDSMINKIMKKYSQELDFLKNI
jgi:hypothetical protein